MFKEDCNTHADSEGLAEIEDHGANNDSITLEDELLLQQLSAASVVADASNLEPDVKSNVEEEPIPVPSKTLVDELGQCDDVEGDGPKSSVENIIPPRIQKGWGFIKNWVEATAAQAKEKAIELNNSESVQEIKRKARENWGKTVEAATPYWEKTKETATPYWEKTKETATPYWEKTKETAGPILAKAKENAVIAVEAAKENAAIAAENIKPAAEAGWKKVAEIAAKFTDSKQDHGDQAIGLERADKGEPMIV